MSNHFADLGINILMINTAAVIKTSPKAILRSRISPISYSQNVRFAGKTKMCHY